MRDFMDSKEEVMVRRPPDHVRTRDEDRRGPMRMPEEVRSGELEANDK